jgi:hypothetical protein
MHREENRWHAKRAVSWVTLALVALALLISGLSAEDQALRAASAPMAAAAETTGATLIVYNDLALVQEERTIDLTKGSAEYQLGNVTDTLLSDSVHLEAPELEGLADIMIAEQQYQHAEKLSLDRLLAAHLGQKITVFAPGGAGTYQGKLLSTQGGVILEDDTGSIQVIQDATRFAFPGYRVANSPQLMLTLDSPIAGPHPLRLSYLTEGLQWQVSYIGILNAAATQMDLESTVSLNNDSGLNFKAAQLTLVAGQLHRVAQPRAVGAALSLKISAPAPPSQFEEQPTFEYHRYQLDRPVALPTGQTVQLSFVNQHNISVEERYIYDAQMVPGVQVHVLFTNPDVQSPSQGVALPAGLLRLYQRGQTGLQFIGEDTIAHTPRGGQVELTAGTAFDLSAKRVLTGHESLKGGVMWDSFEIMLTNHKADDVKIEVREHLQGDWKIVSAEPDYTKRDASTIAFNVPVAAGETKTVKYTVEYHY